MIPDESDHIDQIRTDSALALAPERVCERLRDAHPRPFVGVVTRRGGFWSGRVGPERAWDFPYIQIERAGSNFPALVFDCDRPRELGNVVDFPAYSWLVRNDGNGHAHVVWCLACPVHCYPEARQAPLDYLRHVAEYMHDRLGADPGYAHVLTVNPIAPPTGRTTLWGSPKPYELGELAKVIPFGWKPPRVSQTGVGRNCDLFRDLMVWAGQKRNASVGVLSAAHVRNLAFAHPLSDAEVAGIARSVERYRARWAARGWHSRLFLARQAARGRKSKRGMLSQERPWEAEGVSRATWYRRRKRVRQ